MSEEITPYQVVPKTPLAGSAAADIREQGEISRRSFPFVLTLAWVSLTAALGGLASVLGRFMFPNVLNEPPQQFKAGFPNEYGMGVDERFKDKYGVWIIRTNEDIVQHAAGTVDRMAKKRWSERRSNLTEVGARPE